MLLLLDNRAIFSEPVTRPMSKTTMLRAASARVRNLLIRTNDIAYQLEGIGRNSDAAILRGHAMLMTRMTKRLSDDADLARDPRGSASRTT